MDSLGSPYVMVVDDDDEIREALSDVLTDEGYEVVGARDGQQALQFLREGRRPHAILLDLWMPVMDGWQLRHELLSDMPPHSDTCQTADTSTGSTATGRLPGRRTAPGSR